MAGLKGEVQTLCDQLMTKMPKQQLSEANHLSTHHLITTHKINGMKRHFRLSVINSAAW